MRGIWAIVIALCVVGATARQLERRIDAARRGDHGDQIVQRAAFRAVAGRRPSAPRLAVGDRLAFDAPATVAAPTARRSCAVIAASVRGAPPATLAIAAVRSRGPPRAS